MAFATRPDLHPSKYFRNRDYDDWKLRGKNTIQAALCHRMDLPTDKIGIRDSEVTRVLEQKSLAEFCRACNEIDGVEDDPWFIRNALSGVTASNAFTTSVNAKMVEGWEAIEDTTDWCTTEQLTNYKENSRVRVEHDESHNLSPTPRGSTAKHVSVETASTESYNGYRFARQMVIDEQDIEDDNVTMLRDMPMRLGMAARRLRPDLVYYELLSNPELADGDNLISATRGNNGTDALDSAALGTACAWLRTQTENNVEMGIVPGWLVVAPALEETARKLLKDREIENDGGALKLRVEPRLQNGVTDPLTETTVSGTTTQWYVIGRNHPTIEVGQLSDRPGFRRYQLEQGRWGLGFDLSWTIGVKAIAASAIYRGNV